MTPILLVTLALLAQTDPAEPPPPVEPPPAEAPPAEAPPAVEAPPAEAPVVEAPVVEAPVEAAPVVAPAPTPPAPDVPSEADCLALVKEQKQAEARDCYARRTALDGGDGVRARALADLVSNLRLAPPGELEARSEPSPSNFAPGFDVGALLTSGKAELVVTSTLAGGYLAVLGAGAVLQNVGTGGPFAAALLFLAPVAGGGAGLVASGLAVAVWPGMTAGDANAMRAFLVLGAWDSALLPIQLSASENYVPPSVAMLGMGAVLVSGAALGVGTAILTDLPEGAGSMALSGGLWSTVLVGLGSQMVGAFKTDTRGVTSMLFWSSNLGFAGGLLASQLVPMTRGETWALDVGGAVGLLGGAAVAVYGRAPNPFLGWGSMALGTALGMGAGYATAHFVPELLADDGKGKPVAVSPFVVPDPSDVSGRTVVMGAMLQGAL